MNRAAIYARYSSDLQSPASIEDQIRKCQQYADSHGFTVLDQYMYQEPALSATTMVARPALQRLLRTAESKPCPFEVILVDDTSRLSRDTADQLNMQKRLKFAGIRFIAVAQGIDSDNEQAQVLMTVHGMVDSLYVQELAKKTHRGMEGKALKGFSTGGSTYGYHNIQTPEGFVKEVIQDEAAVVHHIFELADHGYSLDGIVRKLNAEGIRPPRPRDKRQAGWHPHAIREMLRNTTYIGLLIWNRQKFIRTPEGKRVSRPRDESEWVRAERPELRIIDNELWQRVQNQLQWKRERFGRGGGGLYHAAGSTSHLLSGLLKCSECGGNLIIHSGYRDRHGKKTCYFACANHAVRHSCNNDLRESEARLEELLLAGLEQYVLRAEIIDFAITEFTKELKTRLADVTRHLDQDRKREAVLKSELKNLWAVIATGGDFDSLRSELAERETELKTIRDRILGAGRDSVDIEVAEIRAYVTRELMNLRQRLKQDVVTAKHWLNAHVDAITMTPTYSADGKRFYRASGKLQLLGGPANVDPCGGWI